VAYHPAKVTQCPHPLQAHCCHQRTRRWQRQQPASSPRQGSNASASCNKTVPFRVLSLCFSEPVLVISSFLYMNCSKRPFFAPVVAMNRGLQQQHTRTKIRSCRSKRNLLALHLHLSCIFLLHRYQRTFVSPPEAPPPASAPPAPPAAWP
jgi:hypothetical protein